MDTLESVVPARRHPRSVSEFVHPDERRIDVVLGEVALEPREVLGAFGPQFEQPVVQPATRRPSGASVPTPPRLEEAADVPGPPRAKQPSILHLVDEFDSESGSDSHT